MDKIKHELEVKMVMAIYREFNKRKLECKPQLQPQQNGDDDIDICTDIVVRNNEQNQNKQNIRLKKSIESDEHFAHFNDDNQNDVKIKYMRETFDNSSFKSIEKCFNNDTVLLDCEFKGNYFNDLYEADKIRYDDISRKENNDIVYFFIKKLFGNF